MDKLKQIEAFIAVVEHGSMAAAALTQNVTPVMIGRRINALEARIGVKLLHRSTRRIVVTEQGAAFMEQCKKALSDLDRAEMLIAEGRHKATGHLIVSAPAAFGRKHVAPHAPAFLAANPDVQISFNLTDRVVAAVADEITRILRPGGFLLTCELTDPSHADGAIYDPDQMFTIGRPVAKYEALFHGLTLRETRPRRVEPHYPSSDQGTYRLFVK